MGLHLLLLFILCYNATWANEERWKCNDGMEINLAWKCDGRVDCLDRSDESLEVCPRRECEVHEFRCDSGACIPEALVCNFEDDCNTFGVEDDFSDEQNCEDIEHPKCDFATQHECSNGYCILLEWICDGDDDCEDRSDEEGCDQPCYEGHVLCNNSHHCIEERWICDGEKDCEEGEDESNCSITTASTTMPGLCDVNDLVCIGNLNSSNQGDERAHCQPDVCRQRSDPMVWSSRCPLCDHLCHLTPEGPKCSCESGYTLELDRLRCRTEDSVLPKLYYYANREIRALLLHYTTPLERIEYMDHKNLNMEVTSIDFNYRSQTLYWVEKNSNVVKQMHNSMRTSVFIQALGVTGISLDWIAQNLYISYVSSTNEGKVGVVTVDENKDLNQLLDLELVLIYPIQIVVHPKIRKLVVLDQGNSQTPRLILADMDGKNMEVLATVHRRMITSVTVDRVIDIIYWSEVNDEEASIEMMKLGGRQRKTLISTNDHDIAFSYPSSLAAFEGKLYFSDKSTREIWTIDSVTGKPSNFVKSHPEALIKVALAPRLSAITIFHPIMQTPAENSPCDALGCSDLCVLRPGGGVCLCPSSMILINSNTCIGIHTETILQPDSLLPTTASAKQLPTSTSVAQNFSTETILKTRSTSLVPSSSISSNFPNSTTSTGLLANSKSTSISTTQTKFSTTPKHIPSPSTVNLTFTATTVLSTTSSLIATSTSSTLAKYSTTPQQFPNSSTVTFIPSTTTLRSKSMIPRIITSKLVTLPPESVSAIPTVGEHIYSKPAVTNSVLTLNTLTSSNLLASRIKSLNRIYLTDGSIKMNAPPKITVRTTHYCLKPQNFETIVYTGLLRPKYIVDSKVSYSCLTGWRLSDSSNQTAATIRCSENGKWNLTMCERVSCSDLDCGKNGECVSLQNNGTVCKCWNGNLTLNVCTPNLQRSSPQSKWSNTGLTVGYVFVGILLLFLGVLTLYTCHKKRRNPYALFEEDASKPAIKGKSKFDKHKSDINGSFDLNFFKNRRKTSVSSYQKINKKSYTNPKEVYSYTFLKKAVQAEISSDEEKKGDSEALI